MKLEIHQEEYIKQAFQEMESKVDFLSLLNFVKPLVYGPKSIPFKLTQLNYHSNPKANPKRYLQFSIKKKTGGERKIHAPNAGLKAIQKCLNVIFQVVYDCHPAAYGFVPGKSILDNATVHARSYYVYNIDLKDFFPSIDQARIWGRLKHPPFNLTSTKSKHTRTKEQYISDFKVFFESLGISADEVNVDEKQLEMAWKIENESRDDIRNMIAILCCHEMVVERMEDGQWIETRKYVLPQGASTSPILTNIICQQLDFYLSAAAKKYGVKYTRYADDITFSSLHNIYQKDSEFITEVNRIITSQNFHIKESKTRLQKQGFRQEVTGVIVNESPNVQKRYIKQLRLWLYRWESLGFENAEKLFRNQYIGERGNIKKRNVAMQNVIAGKLEYLKMIKGADNPTYVALKNRFAKLINLIFVNKDSPLASSTNIDIALKILNEEGLEAAMEYYLK